jgi:aspartyl-tRNA(Asn)/glutamyl-tRNA(Gln) amidotransferase subunit B
MTWDTVIGLEVHAQLCTQSKLFSSASTRFGAAPNSQTNYIDAGLPGVLPVLNHQAVIMAIRFGLAINAHINQHSYFERKNYFYPDLPKGYQISQFQCPIVSHGHLLIDTNQNIQKRVDILRAHLEEDAGKSMHDIHPNYTGIDLNRAGIALLEIVTTPCLYSAHEVIAYLRTLHELVRFLGICDGNMQAGSFRCDVNISLKPNGSTKLGTRTELKNLNSFRFIEQAINYEQSRQQACLEQGLPINQETRLFCPTTQTTKVLRCKENENDYRYFPDPDLLPIVINSNDIDTVKKQMPELPQAIRQRLNQHISLDDCNFLLATPAIYHYFLAVKSQTIADEQTIINWLKGPYSKALYEANLSFNNPPVDATRLAELLTHCVKHTISHNIARQIFTVLWQNDHSVAEIISQKGFNQHIEETTLKTLITTLIGQYPKQAADYRLGREKLLAFFVGHVMKETKGQANPEQVNQLIKEALSTIMTS